MTLADHTERGFQRTASSIAKIDTAHARRIGQLLVTQAEDMEVPEKVLFDMESMTAADMMRDYDARMANYATAPFDPLGNRLRFHKGGVTIWSGYPGAGKTTLLRQLACHLLHSKHGVFFASLEENPTDLLIRLGGVAFGVARPSADQLQWFCDYYATNLRLWGVMGIASHRKLLSTIQALAKQGVTHAIIDSLMCLDIENDDYERQRVFANLLAAVARTTDVHIHLVAHPRKVVSADQEPDINDVAGAREIGGIADNVIFVRRGKDPVNEGDVRVKMGVAIRKQRHGNGGLGEISGWFNRRLKQFKSDQFDDLPTRYLPDAAYDGAKN